MENIVFLCTNTHLHGRIDDKQLTFADYIVGDYLSCEVATRNHLAPGTFFKIGNSEFPWSHDILIPFEASVRAWRV